MIHEQAELRQESSTAAPLRERVRSLRLPEVPQGRSGLGGWVAWVLCVVFASSTAGLSYVVWNQQSAARASADPADPGTSAIASAVPGPEAPSGDIVLESKGYVVPVRQILVSPQVSGQIVELSIWEGKQVRPGEVLAKLETTDYEHDVRRAQAAVALAQHRLQELESNRPKEIEQARAELGEAETQLRQLRSEFERSEELFRKQKVLAEQDYELAKSKYEAAQRRVERLASALALVESSRARQIAAAQAQVELAQAELAKAEWRLGNCTIKAPEPEPDPQVPSRTRPVVYTVLRKNAEKWNIVNPIAFNGSYSLCEIADLADLEIELTIQERDIGRVFLRQKCRIRSEAFPERVYEGYVSRLMPIADRAKGAIPVRVKVVIPPEETGQYLKPEMGAIVSFLKHEVKEGEAGGASSSGRKPGPLGSPPAP